MRELILRSLETSDAARCVDVCQREDGSYGFEIYRRDVEDASNWFAIGGFAGQCFATDSDAISVAAQYAPWITEE